MRPYIVKQGDYLAKIANAAGVKPEVIWDDPKNQELRSLRPNPDTLLPGDVIFVPERERRPMRLDIGATNRIIADVPEVDVHIELCDDEGPLADEPYELEGLGETLQGRSDSSGKVSFKAFIHLRTATVSLPDRGVSYEVRLGDMDPVEELSGVRARLTNLGYYLARRGPRKKDSDEALVLAVKRFQADQGLPVTGEIDRALLDTLVSAHGS
jgi:hypothetical protein